MCWQHITTILLQIKLIHTRFPKSCIPSVLSLHWSNSSVAAAERITKSSFQVFYAFVDCQNWISKVDYDHSLIFVRNRWSYDKCPSWILTTKWSAECQFEFSPVNGTDTCMPSGSMPAISIHVYRRMWCIVLYRINMPIQICSEQLTMYSCPR